jgi:folate-dependent phosphoribosylglycinamide formyltransferase PurN
MKIATAILMSGGGSNARRLLESDLPALDIRLLFTDNPDSGCLELGRAFGIEACCHDLYSHCGLPARGGSRRGRPAGAEELAGLKDPALRASFDERTAFLLAERGIRLAAAAGYGWILSAPLCRRLIIVNVHPGDLRPRDERGRRRYVGLGWVPSARAILAGEAAVHTSTHLIVPELDGGPIARVSRPVPVVLPAGTRPADLLPPGAGLRDVVRDLAENRGRRYGDCLLVRTALRLQEELKVRGDWVEFPRTLQGVAELMLAGRLTLNASGSPELDGAGVPDLFLQDAEETARG